VGGVDVLLVSPKPRTLAGVGVASATSLWDLEPCAAVAVVGDHSHPSLAQGLKDAVLAGGAHVVASPGKRG
jgi:hypothetical protein